MGNARCGGTHGLGRPVHLGESEGAVTLMPVLEEQANPVLQEYIAGHEVESRKRNPAPSVWSGCLGFFFFAVVWFKFGDFALKFLHFLLELEVF